MCYAKVMIFAFPMVLTSTVCLSEAVAAPQSATSTHVAWLKSRADANDAQAFLFLGYAHLTKPDGKLPIKRPPFWVDSGLREYWEHAYALITDADFVGDPCEGVALYKRAVELGNTNAMSRLGTAYAKGVCGKKDCAAAMSLFERASQMGNPDGWTNIGVQHATGCGREVNRALAESFYRKAAEAGSAMGMYNLAGCYRKREENSEAIRWLRRAAELRHPEAINNLGFMHEHGLGTIVDMRKACQLYTEASELGISEAMESRERVCGK